MTTETSAPETEVERAAARCRRVYGTLLVSMATEFCASTSPLDRATSCVQGVLLQQWDMASPTKLVDLIDRLLTWRDIASPVKALAFDVRSAARSWAMLAGLTEVVE